ncbi:MAG: N-acetylmuramoyl-L-alanine amidase [Bacteroidales bacterium]|nr:N-acetylmuramoyl-L-alanine amidase [Bacteroidales bacterium]
MRRILHIFLLFVVTITCSIHVSGQNTVNDLGLRTVVIDPGHGGKDPGALGKTRKTDEKHIVLSVSKKLGDKIKAAYPDVKVVYTRSTDVFVELKERADIAKRNKADLFISIHCNSAENTKAYGASAWILGPKSTRNPKNTSNYFEKSQSVAQRENSVMLLEDDYKTSYQDFNPESAESVISSNLLWMANYENSLMFAAEYDSYIRKAPYRVSSHTGIHQDVFYLLWATNMPSALLEIGFISNSADYAILSTEDGQEKIAQSIFNSLCNYKTKYDASVNVVSEPILSAPAPETKPAETKPAPAEKASEVKKTTVPTGVHYGVQIMGLGRKLDAKDPALKGLTVEIVAPADGGKIYKYVAAWSDSLDDAKAQLASVRKKFPDAFLVKVDGNDISRIK